MSWLTGPLCGFDLESTGVSVEHDRIVTACVGFAREPGDWLPRNWMINPGVPIPEAATAVHGITDAVVQADGLEPADGLEQIDRALQTAWAAGAPVIGFNLVFDLTLLDRELRRHLGRPLVLGGPVLDGLVIDKAIDPFRRGSRKLTDVCTHYGVPLVDAHTADADAFAAVRVTWLMIKNGVLPEQVNGRDGRRGEAIVLADLTAADLTERQAGWYRTQRQSFFAYLARKGDTPDNDNTVWPVAPYAEEAQAVA